MRCPQCNSSKKISIKGKPYCADCGYLLETTGSPEQPATHKAPAKKSAQRKSNLLDLSRQNQPRSRRPSQTIHGVRRSHEVNRPVSAQASVTKPELSISNQQSRRAQHAQQIVRSPKVAKFSQSAPGKPAAAEPAEQPPVILNPHETYIVNQKVGAANRSAAIAMHHQRSAKPEAALHTSPPKRPSRRKRWIANLSNLFKRPRFAMSAATTLAVLLLAGYISYLNYPSLALRLAASRAGIDANLPSYTPSGYSFAGPLQYEAGRVTIRFNSNADAGFVNLSQSKTTWDSASLLENHVLQKSRDFITFQENGLTIYMYGGNNAAWVNRGMLYTIEGNNFLNSEQIIKMATSL